MPTLPAMKCLLVAVAGMTLLAATELPQPTKVTCGRKEAFCLQQGLLPVSDGSCRVPLERGICPEGYWTVLDINTIEQQFRGVCAPRPCPPGALLVAGRCAREEEARAVLCAGAPLHLDAAGKPRCAPHPGWPHAVGRYVRCLPVIDASVHRVVYLDGVKCAQRNDGSCAPVVHSPLPRVVIKPEK